MIITCLDHENITWFQRLFFDMFPKIVLNAFSWFNICVKFRKSYFLPSFSYVRNIYFWQNSFGQKRFFKNRIAILRHFKNRIAQLRPKRFFKMSFQKQNCDKNNDSLCYANLLRCMLGYGKSRCSID